MRAAILVALGLVVASPSTAQVHICQSAVDAQLTKHGIAADRVSSTAILNEISGSREDVRVGYKFWMRMKSCSKGYLVVDTDLQCTVWQTYTDGPCKISGVPDC